MSTMLRCIFNNECNRLIQRDTNTAAFNSSLVIDNGLIGASLVFDQIYLIDKVIGSSQSHPYRKQRVPEIVLRKRGTHTEAKAERSFTNCEKYQVTGVHPTNK